VVVGSASVVADADMSDADGGVESSAVTLVRTTYLTAYPKPAAKASLSDP
jgi:hypothetical protein